ncbi:MAG TPA: hypothetical protein VJ254_12400, partial [Streptosporangiaceae bacterium]|nr:hypothetical protein [Streptosporangiaceae bacterium]
ECYSTPNSAAVNMGPRYSSDGAVQYALSQHVSKVVFDQSNVPGTGYIAAGPAALAKAANTPIVQLTENVPISDADSVAIKEVDDAGPNGAVILNFTPPEALVILQAAQKLGYYIIDSGIAPECYSTPNSAAVNMGPRYSSDGAVQYALAQHVSKVVFDQSNVPGTGYIAAGPAALAKAANVPIVQLTENVPISDADSVAIKEVDDAGPNGAVILNFTPPEALVILQAAQKLGLEDHVKLWGCSTPCNTDFLAQSLGAKWNNKLFVNAELTPPDGTNTTTMNLYKAILKQYGSAVSGGIGSFSQMGFTEAEIAVHALESITGAYTVASVNAALKGVSNFNTGMLCQLWTYGSYPLHIPNNEDYTVTPDNGQMVTAQGCTQISSVDPQIAQYRSVAGTEATAPTT